MTNRHVECVVWLVRRDSIDSRRWTHLRDFVRIYSSASTISSIPIHRYHHIDLERAESWRVCSIVIVAFSSLEILTGKNNKYICITSGTVYITRFRCNTESRSVDQRTTAVADGYVTEVIGFLWDPIIQTKEIGLFSFVLLSTFDHFDLLQVPFIAIAFGFRLNSDAELNGFTNLVEFTLN